MTDDVRVSILEDLGKDALKQFLEDVHYIARDLKRIADVQDGTQHQKWAEEYRRRTGKSWVP